jgi:hypothetical protein
MTRAENKMLTMKIIKLLGIAGIAILAASFMATRAQRRDEEERRRLNERLEKERWESEGGASRTGPAQLSTYERLIDFLLERTFDLRAYAQGNAHAASKETHKHT